MNGNLLLLRHLLLNFVSFRPLLPDFVNLRCLCDGLEHVSCASSDKASVDFDPDCSVTQEEAKRCVIKFTNRKDIELTCTCRALSWLCKWRTGQRYTAQPIARLIHTHTHTRALFEGHKNYIKPAHNTQNIHAHTHAHTLFEGHTNLHKTLKISIQHSLFKTCCSPVVDIVSMLLYYHQRKQKIENCSVGQ